MGGAGNSGQEPEAQKSALVAGGSMPTWAGTPTSAPATPAAAPTAPVRGFEPSTTAAAANPALTANLGFPSVNPGFTHSSYPAQAAPGIVDYTAPAPVAPVATTPAEPAVKPRKAADNVLIDYGHLSWNNPSAYAAQSEIANSIRMGFDKKDWQQFLQFAGSGWKPSAELQEYMDPAERW